jgi:hypothetical protein
MMQGKSAMDVAVVATQIRSLAHGIDAVSQEPAPSIHDTNSC